MEEPACYSLSLSSGDSYSGHLPPGSPTSHLRLGNVWPTASPSPRTLPILLCGLPDLGPRPGTETPPPPRLTIRPVLRSTRRPAPRAARCCPTAAPRRSSCRASSRCLRCWCSPRPLAPTWPDASTRCCRPPLGAPDPAASPTGRSSSAPGCDPRRLFKSRRPSNYPVSPISGPRLASSRVCVQIPARQARAQCSDVPREGTGLFRNWAALPHPRQTPHSRGWDAPQGAGRWP